MEASKKHVFIHYGPYESCGVVSHRADRLEGMTKLLRSKGHQVESKESLDRNTVELWVKGELVYKCKIEDLEFGGDGLMDKLCSEALEAVNKAF